MYRINAEDRTYESMAEIETEGDNAMDAGGQVSKMACGSDFILTTNSSGNVYAKGANRFGQLGIGTTTPSENFKCIDSLLDSHVDAIFAGSRSAFAFTNLSSNCVSKFVQEFNS